MKKSSPKLSPGVAQLREIQRAFATGVMRPLTEDDHMQPAWSDGRTSEAATATFIKPNDRLTSFDRLEIYNRQYWFRLLESLYEDFPGLRTIIGEQRFHELSVAYLTDLPSRCFTLRDLGDRLDEYVTANPGWVKPHEPLAHDLLHLEWAHIVAFDAGELPPLEIDALLDGADPATLKLHFQPYLTFLECEYPVDDFLLAVRRRTEPRGEASNAIDDRPKRKRTKKVPRPRAEKIWLAIHRSENVVYYKRLEREAYMICHALQQGLPLQDACEQVAAQAGVDETFGIKLQTWFTQWAAMGWFCRGE